MDNTVISDGREGMSPSNDSGLSINLTSSIDEDEDDRGNRVVGLYLWMYMSPIVFVVGIFGNTIIIILMRSKKLQGTTSSVYLPLLAIADIATLMFGIIPEWLEHCNIVVMKELNQWVCKFEKFLFYTASDCAIWILVAFTFDRFIAVCFPLRKLSLCRKKNAMITCIVILCSAVAKNFHVYWTRGSEYDEEGNVVKNCGRPDPYAQFELYVRPWIAFTLVSAIPFIVIFSCNVFIIKTLLEAQKMRASSSGSKTFTQTTMMCMSASLTFLVVVTPSIILLIGRPYWEKNDDGGKNHAYTAAKSVANQLTYVNHSINFFLYCLTGERFRSELSALFKCGKSRKASTTNTTEHHKKASKKLSRNYSESNLFDETVNASPNGKYTKTMPWSETAPDSGEVMSKETVT